MKELAGFVGRLLVVYGIPLVVIIAAAEFDLSMGGVLIGAVIWMFILSVVTRSWEDWGR